MPIPNPLNNATVTAEQGKRISNLLAPYFRDLLAVDDLVPRITELDVHLNTPVHLRMTVHFHCLPREVIFKALMAYVEQHPTKILDDEGNVIVTAELKDVSVGHDLVSGYRFVFDFFGPARDAVGRGFARVFED